MAGEDDDEVRGQVGERYGKVQVEPRPEAGSFIRGGLPGSHAEEYVVSGAISERKRAV